MLLYLSLLNMPEYAWMYLNKQDSEYALGPKYAKILNMAKFWIWQDSQYASVLHSVLDMSEYALAEFWIYLRF